VLAEIKSLQQQLAQRIHELPDQQPFPHPYLNFQVENALIDRVLVQRHGAHVASGEESVGAG